MQMCPRRLSPCSAGRRHPYVYTRNVSQLAKSPIVSLSSDLLLGDPLYIGARKSTRACVTGRTHFPPISSEISLHFPSPPFWRGPLFHKKGFHPGFTHKSGGLIERESSIDFLTYRAGKANTLRCNAPRSEQRWRGSRWKGLSEEKGNARRMIKG